MNNKNVLNFIVGAVLVIILALLVFSFQVRQSEVVLVTTFGKPSAKPITEPGLYFKWPWPIQRVNRFDNRVQNFEDKFNETLTADNNNLILTVYAGWKISDASLFYPKFVGSVPAAQNALDSMLRNAKNSVVGQHKISDFVNPDSSQLKFDQMEKEILDNVQDRLSKNDYGIELEFVGFKKIELPASVTQSVFDRMKNERQVLINSEESDGARDAAIIKSTADRQAAETIADANATAVHIQGEGEAAAAEVLPVFEKNPALANYLLRIDALKQSLNQQTTLMFDERTPPFDLFTSIPTNGLPQ
jgi:modulator of FtsH protease HflC